MKCESNPSADPVTSTFGIPHAVRWDRRRFVKGLSTFAGFAGLLNYDIKPVAAEPPPETTRIRLIHAPVYCLAPQYLAEELLRLEGFTKIEYVEASGGASWSSLLASGTVDLTMDTVPDLLRGMDAGQPIVVLAGIHAGCYELFGNGDTRAVRDLRGKKVAINSGGGDYVFIASIAAYVGLDPRKDIHWIDGQSFSGAMSLFVDGKVDAFLAFPPQPQELRAKKFGRVIVNTVQDRPWSQYFCCVVAGNGEFVQKNPIATKRALRAYLKAADICAREPERAAQFFVAKGYEPRYDLTLEVVKGLPYGRWREADPEDTLRFHLLRLHEVGMISSNPKQIIARNTDWRFLNELKRELKS